LHQPSQRVIGVIGDGENNVAATIYNITTEMTKCLYEKLFSPSCKRKMEIGLGQRALQIRDIKEFGLDHSTQSIRRKPSVKIDVDSSSHETYLSCNELFVCLYDVPIIKDQQSPKKRDDTASISVSPLFFFLR
jgi:hypothetical protein